MVSGTPTLIGSTPLHCAHPTNTVCAYNPTLNRLHCFEFVISRPRVQVAFSATPRSLGPLAGALLYFGNKPC